MFDDYVSVASAARCLGVSERRIRALLAQGRIVGCKPDGRTWKVRWPLDVKPGKRGPDLVHFPIRHVYSRKKAKTK